MIWLLLTLAVVVIGPPWLILAAIARHNARTFPERLRREVEEIHRREDERAQQAARQQFDVDLTPGRRGWRLRPEHSRAWRAGHACGRVPLLGLIASVPAPVFVLAALLLMLL